jgi:hypothetical protein
MEGESVLIRPTVTSLPLLRVPTFFHRADDGESWLNVRVVAASVPFYMLVLPEHVKVKWICDPDKALSWNSPGSSLLSYPQPCVS